MHLVSERELILLKTSSPSSEQNLKQTWLQLSQPVPCATAAWHREGVEGTIYLGFGQGTECGWEILVL